MKLLSSYIKEMKIAARGFYFYIEIIFAVILLVILLVVVKEEPVSRDKEFLFYDMDRAVMESIFADDIEEGVFKVVDDTIFEAKAVSFELEDRNTGKIKEYDFEEETLSLETYEGYDRNTGKFDKTLYFCETEEDMLRMSYSEKTIGARITHDDDYKFFYDYILQGYETEKFTNVLYVLHNENPDVVEEAYDAVAVRKLDEVEVLNSRENMVPVFLVFMGSLMGLFIVMAYIFLDKSEGVIKAFAVSPSSVWIYLMSKTMVIMTTVVISTTIITIPVMGLQPNYPLLYLFILITTFTVAALGLFIASFYDTISKAFGVLYGSMIVLMIPGFSYYIPSFDPLWLRFFPTYPMLQAVKEIIMVNTDMSYVMTYSGVFFVAGVVLFALANQRFKKTLTV